MKKKLKALFTPAEYKQLTDGVDDEDLQNLVGTIDPLTLEANIVPGTDVNQRPDVNTDPDPYSQTTPSDIGMLLEDLYMCEQTGGGTLIAVFPGQITQAKCQMMINYLKNNKLPVLLTAGLPEGTQIAHKHGWVSTQGIINTIGDAGIIYTPGGNYVLTIFLHHPVQLIWDPASTLVAKLSQAVYNYYNPPTQ